MMDTPGADSRLPSPSRRAGANVSPVALRKQLGTPGSVSRGMARAVSMRPQDARMVYFDPADELPSNDKPVGERVYAGTRLPQCCRGSSIEGVR